jgi:hypothetical protein
MVNAAESRQVRSFRIVALIALLVIGFAIPACNQAGPKLYPVRGQVFFKDQPAEGAQVVFQPVASGEAKPGAAADLFSSGTVAADGSYTLQTYPHGAGAPAGEYNVIITWFPPNTGLPGNPINKLPAKYADQQTPLLKATVKEGDNEIPPFKLTP